MANDGQRVIARKVKEITELGDSIPLAPAEVKAFDVDKVVLGDNEELDDEQTAKESSLEDGIKSSEEKDEELAEEVVSEEAEETIIAEILINPVQAPIFNAELDHSVVTAMCKNGHEYHLPRYMLDAKIKNTETHTLCHCGQRLKEVKLKGKPENA
jgi:hypothetical protein